VLSTLSRHPDKSTKAVIQQDCKFNAKGCPCAQQSMGFTKSMFIHATASSIAAPKQKQ